MLKRDIRLDVFDIIRRRPMTAQKMPPRNRSTIGGKTCSTKANCQAACRIIIRPCPRSCCSGVVPAKNQATRERAKVQHLLTFTSDFISLFRVLRLFHPTLLRKGSLVILYIKGVDLRGTRGTSLKLLTFTRKTTRNRTRNDGFKPPKRACGPVASSAVPPLPTMVAGCGFYRSRTLAAALWVLPTRARAEESNALKKWKAR